MEPSGHVTDADGGPRCEEASSPKQSTTERTPFLKASPTSVHPTRNIDPLDAARNRLENPYQSDLHASALASSAINSASVPGPGYGSTGTVWTEDRIDENLVPPTRTLKKGATSNLQTMTHMFKGNIGSGILAMPYAFSNSGIWAGFVGTVIIGLIAIHCMRLLVESAHYLCNLTGKETIDYGYCIDYAFKNVQGGGPKIKKRDDG